MDTLENMTAITKCLVLFYSDEKCREFLIELDTTVEII